MKGYAGGKPSLQGWTFGLDQESAQFDAWSRLTKRSASPVGSAARSITAHYANALAVSGRLSLEGNNGYQQVTREFSENAATFHYAGDNNSQQWEGVIR
jgi:hypothetical protein